MEWVTIGLKALVSRGPRFTLVHAGREDDFTNSAELTFLSKENSEDEREEMFGETFEKWFTKRLLLNCPWNLAVVPDNVKYHSKYLEQILTTSWRKGDIKNWVGRLAKHLLSQGFSKKEMMHLVQEHRPK